MIMHAFVLLCVWKTRKLYFVSLMSALYKPLKLKGVHNTVNPPMFHFCLGISMFSFSYIDDFMCPNKWHEKNDSISPEISLRTTKERDWRGLEHLSCVVEFETTCFRGNIGNEQWPEPELGHMVNHPLAGVKHKLTAPRFKNCTQWSII